MISALEIGKAVQDERGEFLEDSLSISKLGVELAQTLKWDRREKRPRGSLNMDLAIVLPTLQ